MHASEGAKYLCMCPGRAKQQLRGCRLDRNGAWMDKEKIEVFICYAHEDELLRQGLEKQLRILRRQGLISIWHDRNISPGTDWQREIDTYLNSAHIILLLVSSDFMDSDYCYSIEMQRAMQRHNQGVAKVLPVILRPVYWQGSLFGSLQALPKDAKPVVSSSWHNQDEAFFDVAEGIRGVVEDLIKNPSFTAPKKEEGSSQKSLGQLLGEGEVFYAQEQYGSALAAFNQAIRVDPNRISAYTWQGKVFYQLKRYEEAIAALDRAIEIDPDDGFAYSWKGAALYQLKEYEEALSAREQAIQKGRPAKEDYTGKGEALYQLKRYEEAIVAFDQSIKIDPSYASTYSWKGKTLYALKRYEEAIVAFDQSIKIDPSYTFAYTWKAEAILEQKKSK